MGTFMKDNAITLILVVGCTALAGYSNGLRKQANENYHEIRELQRTVDAHHERFNTIDRRLITAEDTTEALIVAAHVTARICDRYDAKFAEIKKATANKPAAVEPWVPTTKLPDPDDDTVWFRSIGLNRRWVSEKVNWGK